MFGAAFQILPLLGKIVGFIPGLQAALMTPVAGTIVGKAFEIAQRVFGTTDMQSIELQIQQDKSKLEVFKTEVEAATKEDLAFLADVQNSRNMFLSLQSGGSRMAWGVPVISAVILSVFVIMIFILLNYEITINEFQKGVVVPMLGILTGAAGQVISFWLGSTRASKDKDNVIAAAVSTNAQQAAQQQAQPPRMFT